MTMKIAPHPEYGEGVWTDDAGRDEVLALDASQTTTELVEQIMEILWRLGYDSMDRELAFWHFSQVTGRDYEDFYQAWMEA